MRRVNALLCLAWLFAAVWTIADDLPHPPQGIDCDSCRYWQSLGETI